jgi:iron complex outermembrane receptor protein
VPTRRIRRGREVALRLLLAASGIAVADPAADSLDEIIVTARKVAEPLADVPLAIQVITRQELERSGIDGLQSLSGYVPGLYVEQMWGNSNSQPTIRGQAHPGPGGNTVGIYVDGVLQRNNDGDDSSMFDLERVEVLKGPQSAMYGGSSFAGAINFVTRRPKDHWEREVSLSLGSDAYRRLSVAASGPLGTPGLLGRVTFMQRDFDGTGVNLANPHDNLGGYRKWGGSASLEYASNEAWHFTAQIRMSNDRLEHPAVATVTAAEYNCGSQNPTTGYWSFYCGDIPRARRFDISPDIPDSSTATTQGLLRIEGHGGRWDIDSLTGYYHSDSLEIRDWDASSAGELLGVCTLGRNCDAIDGTTQFVNRLVTVNQVQSAADVIDAVTEELRLRLNAGRYNGMLGVLRTWARERYGDAFGVGPVALAADERLTDLLPATPLIVGPISELNDSLVADANRTPIMNTQQDQIWLTEFFGALDVALPHQVNLHIEARTTAGEYSIVAPRVSVDSRVGSRGLAWASVARGESPGGSNGDPALMSSEQNYGPESDWTYELGFRGPLFERVQLSAALFYYDWQHAQIPGPSNTPGNSDFITRNINGIRTKGLDWSVQFIPATYWSASLGYTYVDPRFKSGSEDFGGIRYCGLASYSTTSNFCTIGPSRLQTQRPIPLVPYVDGNNLQRAPQQQWTAALTYEQPHAADSGGWFMRAALQHQGRVYVRPIDGAWYGERTLLNARIGWAHKTWSVQLWGSNLTDVNYIQAAATRPRAFAQIKTRSQDLIFGDGRRFGLDLHWRF